jgi:hypothetical protein
MHTGFAELFTMYRLADVVSGSAKSNQLGVELEPGEFGRDAVDQRARGVMNQNKMRQRGGAETCSRTRSASFGRALYSPADKGSR